ncbi:MAG TPA: MATE family efflux transporter [Polyangiaceae bacterium]
MTNDSVRDRRVLAGPIVPTFFHYVVPSLIGLLAISTASIVDGVFVGRFIGADALAAVGLLVPYFTLLFGASLMFAAGGVVRAGRCLGAGDPVAAGAIFSKCVVAVGALTLAAGVLANLFDETLFRALGAPERLFSSMRAYLRVISGALVVQMLSLVGYYFVRLDGRPVLATSALVVGAVTNMGLNALFVGYLRWGLPGAAFATGVSQLVQLCVLLRHFVFAERKLGFSLAQRGWNELGRIAFNGASEFANEISGGLVMLLLNWLMMARVGVEGVSAFAAVNFAIFASLMIFYGISDALHLLVSQNLGAGNALRIARFLRTALGSVAIVGALFCLGLLGFGEHWLRLFLEDSSRNVFERATEFLDVVWPLFLVNGVNVVITVYLAAMHRPAPAGLLALGRSLVLPAGFLLVLSSWSPGTPFLLALPLAEWATAFAGVVLLARFRPGLAERRDLAGAVMP